MTKKVKVLRDFLFGSCSFTVREVGRLYAKLRTDHPGRVSQGSRRDKKIVENLQMLKDVGMKSQEVENLFTKLIHALATNPHKLRERWQWYMTEFQLSNEEIKDMAMRCPFFLQYNIDGAVLPVTDAFHDLGVSLEEFRAVMKHSPRVLTCSLDGVKACQELGVSKQGIMQLCYRAPELLTTSYMRNFKAKLEWFQDVAGVDSQVVVNRWLVRYPRVFYGANKHKWQERYDSLIFNGFSKPEISKMMKEYPLLLTRGVDDIGDKIIFLKEVMKRNLQDAARHPVYLTRSFELRISVRLAYMVFKDKSFEKYSLRTLFLPNDKVFSEKYATGSITEYWKFMDWWVKLSRGEMLAYFKLDRVDQVSLGQSATVLQ